MAKPQKITAVCLQYIEYDAEEGGLSAAIRTQDTEHASLRYFEGNIIQRPDPSVGFADVLNV